MADSLAGRTLFITGGSRGIGLAIALRAARDGANVALFAKTAEPHPKLPGTIYTAAEEIEAAGGSALPIVGDVRDDDSVAAAVEQAAERFGGIDILVNNASAISLTPIEQTEPKRYDLMQSINVARHVPGHAGLHPAPQALGQPATSSRSRRRSTSTRAGSARTPPTRSSKYGMTLLTLGCRRGAARGRRGRQHAVAAHDHRHRRGPEPARRRRGDEPRAHAARSTPTRPTRSSSSRRASTPARR